MSRLSRLTRLSRNGRAGRSLRRTLGTAFATGLLLVLVSGVAGLAGVGATADSVDELVSRVQPEELANAELSTSLNEASRGVRGYFATGEPRFLEAYDRGRRQYPGAVARLRALTGPQEAALVERQAQLAQQWFDLYGDPARRPPGDAAQVEATLERGRVLLNEFTAASDELAAQLERTAADLRRRSEATRRLLQLLLVVLGLVGVASFAVVGARTTRAVASPLAGLRDVLGRLAGGDLSARVGGVEGAPFEVQAVAASVNTLAQESERLARAESERTRMRELARGAGLRIREHLDLDAVLGEAVVAVGEALGADRVYVRQVTAGRLGPVTRQWTAPGLEPLAQDGSPSWPLAGDPVAWARELQASARSYVVRDTATEAALQTAVGRARLSVTGSRSVILVPLAAGSDVYGILTVSSVRVLRAWTDPEVELAEAVAADVGRAMHHAQLYEQQRELVDQLRELDRTKSDFLSTVSHELRTPLTSIAGYVELIRDGDVGPVTAEQERMLDVVDRNTRRLKLLIEDLLTLSRIEAGAFRLQVTPVEVADVVRSAADTVRPAAASGGLALDVDPGPPGLRVAADVAQLERVLLNLLSNAIKFSPDGGTVGLRVRTGGPHETAGGPPGTRDATVPGPEGAPGEVVLLVSDTGIGIPESEQERLFGRFFRASNAASRAIQGTGLGLTIVRGIVEAHGGRLALRSAEGVGTTVEIGLPALPGRVAGRSPAPPALGESVPASGAAASGRLPRPVPVPARPPSGGADPATADEESR